MKAFILNAEYWILNTGRCAHWLNWFKPNQLFNQSTNEKKSGIANTRRIDGQRREKMKKIFAALMLIIAMVWFGGVAQAATWETFVIRQSASGADPLINDVVREGQAAKEFVIFAGSQKAGWGTNDLNGKTVGDIAAISIDRLDDYTRFTLGSGPAVGPYINMWITDGAGRYAILANEPSDAEWQPGNMQWDMTWDILKTKAAKIYDTNDKTWLPSNTPLYFSDFANYTIQAPSVDELRTGWSGLGGGAPRELGTNLAYGFNWVFGDTLSNYVSGNEGYVVANPVASVPEPTTLMLLGFGLIGVAAARRKA